MHKSSSLALILLTALLAACGQTTTPVVDPVVTQPGTSTPTTPTPVTPAPIPTVPKKVSLGVYDLPLFGASSDFGAAAYTTDGGSLKFEPQGAGYVDFEGIPSMRFVYTRIRVTNTGTKTVDHLTLLPTSTTSQDASVSGTVAGTPFKNLTYKDGSDASGRATELVTGQAGIPDQYPVTVRPDANASLYVQDLDTSDVSAQAPAGLKIGVVQPVGWRLSGPLAPGESTVMTLGTSIPLVEGSALPANYAMSVVAVDDPSPKINPLSVKLDLTQSRNPGYTFPNWRPNGEAVYMSSGLRMIALAKVKNDASATFNLPGKNAVTPFLSPVFGEVSPECTIINRTVSDSAVQSVDARFTLAENFTLFLGLDLIMKPETDAATGVFVGSRPTYFDRDFTGNTEYQCHVGTDNIHFKSVFQVKAGWNLSTFSSTSVVNADGTSTTDVSYNYAPLTGSQVWTLNPSGNGGVQPPRF